MGYVAEVVKCDVCGTGNAKGDPCWYCDAGNWVDVSWDPMRGTWSVDPCPDCGAGSGEACAWACSSNWDAEERTVRHD